MTKKALSLLLIFAALFSQAQEIVAQVTEPAMADTMRDNGKIYIVVTVIGMIFVALLIFLIYLERKLQKIEEKVNNKLS